MSGAGCHGTSRHVKLSHRKSSDINLNFHVVTSSPWTIVDEVGVMWNVLGAWWFSNWGIKVNAKWRTNANTCEGLVLWQRCAPVWTDCTSVMRLRVWGVGAETGALKKKKQQPQPVTDSSSTSSCRPWNPNYCYHFIYKCFKYQLPHVRVISQKDLKEKGKMTPGMWLLWRNLCRNKSTYALALALILNLLLYMQSIVSHYYLGRLWRRKYKYPSIIYSSRKSAKVTCRSGMS